MLLIIIGIVVFLVLLASSVLYLHYGRLQRPKDARAALVGQYRLELPEGSDCSEHSIESSILELRADGTSEQTDRFKDGSQFVTSSKWEYYEYNKWCPTVGFELIASCDLITFQKLRVTTSLEIDKAASPLGAGLIVAWPKPPKIRLWNDCFFTKVR